MFSTLAPLSHWQAMPHMAPEAWALAWALVHHPAWSWDLYMGEIYPDGSFSRHEGIIARLDQPLPMLLDDCTAGRLLGRLSQTGPGWVELLRDQLQHHPWHLAVAHAVLSRWQATAAARGASRSAMS